MPESKSKIAIIGAGSVGATIAYACMMRAVAKELVIYDIDRAKVDAEALDLNHGLQFVQQVKLEGSDDIGIINGADIVVITAGAKQKPGQSRMDLAQANAGILRTLIPQIINAASNAILLIVTNPCDVMTYVALKVSGLPQSQVLGSGTVLDSSRFRYLIAKRVNVAVQNVHAYIVGEHGDSEIPLWSSATIANIPLHEWAVMQHGKLSTMDRTVIFQNVKTAAQQIIRGKGATNYAIGLATAKILDAILRDENRVMPVSGLLQNYRGIEDVCLSVPCIVNRSGLEQSLPVPMNANEEAGLKNSAEIIRSAIRSLGY